MRGAIFRKNGLNVIPQSLSFEKTILFMPAHALLSEYG